MKQVAVGRLAKVLMKGLVVAAGFAAGISGWADSAQNSFIIISGDADFSQVDDDKILVKGPRGDKRLTYQGREGWGPSNPQSINLPSGGAVKIPVWGLDGENDKNIEIQDDPKDEEDKCTCSTNMVSQHASDPAIGPKVKTADVVAIYSYPEIGVPVPKTIEWIPISNCVHDVYKVISACEKCGTEEQKIFVKEEKTPPGPEYDEDVDAEGAVKGDDGLDYLPYGRHHVKYTAYWKSSDCRENKCHCGAEGYREYFVYLAGLTSPEYIGLDMTDEGKKTWKEYEASASITPDEDRSKTVSWELVSNHSVFEDGTKSAKTDGEPVKFGGLKKDPTPSEKYRGETLKAIVTLPDAEGENGSATVTNAFTVVQVDVKIAKGKENGNGDEKGKKNVEAKDVFVDEDKEESEGAYLYHVPDAIGTLWTQEGTNALKQVVFSVMPNDLPKDQKVTIDVRKGLLFEKKDGQYKPAKSSYTLEELAKVTFWLHGHDRSEEYLGDSITLTHDLSGAKDVAKFTIFGRPWLVPDYDRDGKIDDADEAKAKDGKTVFRFWINDDGDHGNMCPNVSYSRDVPNERIDLLVFDIPKRGRNCKNDEVDGRNDLEDFTPIWISLCDVFPKNTPEEIKEKFAWMMKSKCVNVVWTIFKRTMAGQFLKDDVVCAYNDKNEAVVTYNASVDRNKREAPKWFLDTAYNDEGREHGVILIEGAEDGSDLQFVGTFGDMKISSVLKCQISDVEKMYRRMSLRDSDSKSERLNSPVNRPDTECDGCNYVFVHGFNVNAEESRANAAEVFKRLWQTGLKSMFTEVDWPGDDEQFSTVSEGTLDPNYYLNGWHAFDVASNFSARCNQALPGTKIVMAHSLGNMLVSSAAIDYGLQYEKYYMLNAAVAQEAYDESSCTEVMVEGDWSGGKIDAKYRASRWYRLFDKWPGDFRNSLTWRKRFEGLPNAVNCYAKTEDVVGNRKAGVGNINQPVWPKQELLKGSLLIKEVKFLANVIAPLYWSWSTIPCEGGWGFNVWKHLSDPGKLSAKDMIEHPIFTPFRTNADKMHKDAKYVIADDHERESLRAKFLCDAIPAESYAVGANYTEVMLGNIQLESLITHMEIWPERDNGGKTIWRHNDMKNVAYMFVHQLYEKFINKENE